MIRDQIIEQCLSTRLRQRLLREPDLTLEKTMAIGRSFEASERQASQIEADNLKTTNVEVNAIRSAQDTKSPRPRFPAATTALVIAVATLVTERKTLVFLPKVYLVTTAVNLGILLECADRQAIKKDQNRKNTSQDDINKRTTGSRGEIRYVYVFMFTICLYISIWTIHTTEHQGCFTAHVSHTESSTSATFIVVKNHNSGSLLGHKTAADLGLLPQYGN